MGWGLVFFFFFFSLFSLLDCLSIVVFRALLFSFFFERERERESRFSRCLNCLDRGYGIGLYIIDAISRFLNVLGFWGLSR